MRSLAVLLLAVLLSACNQQEMLERVSSPAEQSEARGYLAALQAGHYDLIERHLDPSLASPKVHNALVRMSSLLPKGTPTSVKLVGAHKVATSEGTTTNTTLEYQWGNTWLLSNVAIRKMGADETIIGLNVYPQKTFLEDQIRFKLSGKDPLQYAIFVAAILAVCLTFFALIVCVRTKELRRKWLWLLFIAVGFGAISTNWYTGAVYFQLLRVQLFSASAMAPFFGPWTISVSVPVGAILFLWQRRTLIAAGRAPRAAKW